MGGLDHGAVPPGEPAAYAPALAGERLRIEPGGGEGGGIFSRNADGEVAAPIGGEIQIEAARAFADVEHLSLDELIGMNEAPETFRVARVFDAIGGRPPKAEPLPPRLLLARQQFACAGAVVRQRIDPGKALRHEFPLKPERAIAPNGENLGEKIAMPVGAASAESELDALLAARASRASLASSTKGQGSSPRQPRGATGALAPISFTILPSARDFSLAAERDRTAFKQTRLYKALRDPVAQQDRAPDS